MLATFDELKEKMEKKVLLEKDHQREESGEKRDYINVSRGITLNAYTRELKRVGLIAGPLVAVNLLQQLLQNISLMMVGHLGEFYLSSSAIAISFCAVTGFSVIDGMSAALETLNGQACGAEQYLKLGTQTYTCLLCLILVCFPLSLIWVYMENILTLMGQDPLVSQEAGKFTLWLVPALFGYALLQSLVQYFQAQSLTIPLLICSCCTLIFHIIFCWILVFKFGLANLGAALSISVSYWFNAFLLALYMSFSSTCEKTRVRVSMDIFQGIKQFFRFAIPSAFMICLESWSYEFLTLISGLLPNPKLQTTILSTCLSTLSTLYTIPDGLSAAASTIISNEIGAGNPQAASIAVKAVMSLAVAESITVSAILFACRHVFGYAFSNEKEIVHYMSLMAPLLCLSVILDSLQSVLSGVARGGGMQDSGAYVNFGAYYLFGIPVSVVLGFWFQLGGPGLWIGIQAGASLQTVSLLILTSFTNWNKKVVEARERTFESRFPPEIGLAALA